MLDKNDEVSVNLKKMLLKKTMRDLKNTCFY